MECILLVAIFLVAAQGACNVDPGNCDRGCRIDSLGQGASLMDQLKLALTWNRVDVAEEKIFTPDADWPVSENIDYEQTLFPSLVLERAKKKKSAPHENWRREGALSLAPSRDCGVSYIPAHLHHSSVAKFDL